MKKIASIFLMALLVLSSTACSGQMQQPKTSESSEQTAQLTESTDTGTSEAGTAEATGQTTSSEPSESSEPVSSETQSSGEEKAELLPFEEITVVDNEQCVIKITGINPDGLWGYTLETYLENKSGSKTYMYAISNASVNGVQTATGFAVKVAPGKKSNEGIRFWDAVTPQDIGDFTDIELTFRVYDSDDWTADDVAEETVHIYPYGQDKAVTFVREAQDTDIILVDNEEISVIVTGCEWNKIQSYEVNLYLVNKTDKELTYSADDASVNGFMAEPFWAASVAPGKVDFTSMSWSKSTLEKNKIADIQDIEMNLRIYDSNDWLANPVFDETVKFNP